MWGWMAKKGAQNQQQSVLMFNPTDSLSYFPAPWTILQCWRALGFVLSQTGARNAHLLPLDNLTGSIFSNCQHTPVYCECSRRQFHTRIILATQTLSASVLMGKYSIRNIHSLSKRNSTLHGKVKLLLWFWRLFADKCRKNTDRPSELHMCSELYKLKAQVDEVLQICC